MRPSRLEGIALEHVPGVGPVELHSLTSGLVNESCRVVRDGRWYALRVGSLDSNELGLDREWECRVLSSAAAAGVGPRIRYCDPATGILVTDWVPGRPLSIAEVGRSDCIDAMARLLRRVHALPIPQPPRALGPAEWISRYSLQGAAYPGTATRSAARGLHAAAMNRLAAVDLCSGAEGVLCHSDLHRFNVAVDGGIVLLDWEYAHVADPYWDLAGWVANNDASAPFARQFLGNYLGRTADSQEEARLQRFAWLYDYVCLLWSELYLNLHAGAGCDSVAARAQRLAKRLVETSGGRAGEVPAH